MYRALHGLFCRAPKFQARQILNFLLLNAAIMFVFAGFLYLFLNSEIEANLASAHVSFNNFREMLFPIVLTLALLNLLASSLVIAVMVLYTSHKIAGPLYRFKIVLDEISGRNLAPFSVIRDQDQLQELSASLTRLTDTLRQDASLIKSGFAELSSVLADGKTPSEVSCKVKQLQTIIERYRI